MVKKLPIKKFSVRLIIFTIIIAIITVIFQIAAPTKFVSPALPFIVLFFFLITELTLYIVLRDSSGRENKKFISGYMLSRIIKFMSCLLFVVLYIITNKEDAWNFGFSFIIIYFSFSIFEVIILKKESTKVEKKKKKEE